MEIRFLTIFIICLVILIVPNITRATSSNLFQITSDGSQQKDPIIFKNIVAYDSQSDIWAYDIDNQTNYPLLQKDGEQYLTGFYKNLVVYDNIDISSSVSQVRMYDTENNTDTLIAGGLISHSGGVTNGKYVVYLDGGACGPIHSYNIKKKKDVVISSLGCQPLRISDDIVIWAAGAPGGSNIYGYNLDDGKSLDIAVYDNFQESANIFEDKVVWYEYIGGGYGDYQAIKTKNLKTGEVKTIYETNTDSLQNPAISGRYIVWSQSPSLNINKVMGADLKTGEIFEVQPLGPHQNSHTMPSIWKNTAVWMSFRTGNGDIYGSVLNK